MKKYKGMIIFFLVVITTIIILVNNTSLKNEIWKIIDNRLDYERSLKVGENFNKIMWGDGSFQINHYRTGNDLEYVKEKEKITLLKSVVAYKIFENRLYVISKEGCVVINGNNIATIYIQLNDIVIKNREKLKYIKSFEDFEKDDQKIFKNM